MSEGSPDLTGAEIYREKSHRDETNRRRSIAQGSWHVIAGPDGQAEPWFVPDSTGIPRQALITIEMLRDDSRFRRAET